MFRTDLPTPENEPGGVSELTRDDLVRAIESTKAEGFRCSEKALLELLSVLDDILGVRGQINYRVKARASTH